MLEGTASDEDKVWPRSARGLAKQAFTPGLHWADGVGTVALTSAAILLLLSRARTTT